jgi:ABC-type uncharacterized transport system permease subunit
VQDPPAAARGNGHERLVTLALYLATVSVALLISMVLVMVAGGSPGRVVTAIVEGSVGSRRAFATTVNQTTPLIIVALASVIAFRAGLVNIGTEGQVAWGGIAGAAVGLKLAGPGPLMLLFVLLGAAAGGALWAGIAAVLQYWRRVDVVISTLLLNFVAYQAISLAVNRPYLLQEQPPGIVDVRSPNSDHLPASVHLPRATPLNMNFHIGIFVALAVAVIVGVVLTRTTWGLKVRMLGFNRAMAHVMGVSAALVGGGALMLSGAVAGLAGGVMLTGTVFRLQDGFTSNVGWDGLMAGLVARRQPALVVPVAFFFGVLRAGGGFLAATGIARFLVDIVQALLVLAAILPPVILGARRRRQLARIQVART